MEEKKVNEKDFFEQNKEKAGNGSAEAQYNLGCCYQYGRGVEMNKEQAIMWYTKAIESGYGKAKLNLGLCYISNLFTMETGYEWIRRAVEEEDNVEAMLYLANCYEKGYGVPADGKEAIKWYKKALKKEMSVSALCNLASIYRYGAQGVAADKKKAIEYFRKAIELGDTDSMYCLAFCYMTGEGVEIDYREALKLYEKAEEDEDYVGMSGMNAEQHIEYCRQMIKEMDKSGEKKKPAKKEPELIQFEKELKKTNDLKSCYAKAWSFYHNGQHELAFKCFTLLAELGHLESQYFLGWFYEHGDGVEQDFQKAWEWYTKSAEANYYQAIFRLGICYEKGFHHIKPDYEKALKWYKLAEKGCMTNEVQLRYGILHYKGLGLEKDYAKAVELLEKHLNNGESDEEALTILAECYGKGLGVEKNEKKAQMYLNRVNDDKNEEDDDEEEEDDEDLELMLYHYSEEKEDDVDFEKELSSCKIDKEKVAEVEKAYKIKAPAQLKRMITMCNDDTENYVSGVEVTVIRILTLDEVLHPKENLGMDYIAMGCVPVAECLNEDSIVYSKKDKKWIWRDNRDESEGGKIYMEVDDILDIIWDIEDESSR